MISLYTVPDLRARIAMYLHGQAVDSQGRKLMEEAEDTLRRAEFLLKNLQYRAEAADRLRAAEVDDGK